MALTTLLSSIRAIALPVWQNATMRRAGIVLLVGLSLLFLARAFLEAGSAQVFAAIDVTDFAAIGLFGIVYGLLLMLLARSWALAPGSSAAGNRQILAVYGTSILPKYIPGSILQYGSRQLLGRQLGWDAALMAHGSLLEVALHVICSLVVALFLLIPALHPAGAEGLAWTIAVIAAALAIATAAMIFVRRRLVVSVLVGSAAYQLAFFAGMAALAAFCGALFGVSVAQLLVVAGLFLVSWLVGFVVPLAPGGIGVREATGVALLSGLIGLETALLVLAAMRLVSLIGDVLMFMLGAACQRALRLTR